MKSAQHLMVVLAGEIVQTLILRPFGIYWLMRQSTVRYRVHVDHFRLTGSAALISRGTLLAGPCYDRPHRLIRHPRVLLRSTSDTVALMVAVNTPMRPGDFECRNMGP